MVDIEKGVSVQFSSSCILTVRGLSVLEINQLNKLFSNSFSSACISERLYREISRQLCWHYFGHNRCAKASSIMPA